MRDGEVEELQLKIYEPPRFFEAFLRGRDFREVPDITARICGICPVAYQMGSCHALEKAMGVFDQVDPAIRALRNVLYCGEWIESHVLHMFLLHLPDFLGFESAISMAADHGPLVKRSLRIKKAGNDDRRPAGRPSGASGGRLRGRILSGARPRGRRRARPRVENLPRRHVRHHPVPGRAPPIPHAGAGL